MRAVGARKKMPAKRKKKITVLPKSAEAGRLRIISIAPVMSRVSASVFNLFVSAISVSLLQNGYV